MQDKGFAFAASVKNIQVYTNIPFDINSSAPYLVSFHCLTYKDLLPGVKGCQ